MYQAEQGLSPLADMLFVTTPAPCQYFNFQLLIYLNCSDGFGAQPFPDFLLNCSSESVSPGRGRQETGAVSLSSSALCASLSGLAFACPGHLLTPYLPPGLCLPSSLPEKVSLPLKLRVKVTLYPLALFSCSQSEFLLCLYLC